MLRTRAPGLKTRRTLFVFTHVLYNKGMESVLKSDIFFFVATIALAVIAIAIVVAVIYAILILRDVRVITDRLKKGGIEIGRMASSFVKMLKGGRKK